MTTSVGTHSGHTHSLSGTGPASNTTGGGSTGSTTNSQSATGLQNQATNTGAAGGPSGNAVAGVAQLKGGGGADLQSVLKSLVEVLQKLADVLKKMQGGATGGAGGGGAAHGCGCGASPIQTGVKGVAGEASTQAVLPMLRTPAPAAAAPASNAGQAAEDHAFEQRVLELVNQARAQHGLGALSYNAQLDAASEKHNAVQIQTRTMAHVGIGDGDPGSRIRGEGWRSSWGENVAVGQRSPEQVVQEWLNSPTHRANILNPNFRYMGVSYGTTNDGFAFWAQSFGG